MVGVRKGEGEALGALDAAANLAAPVRTAEADRRIDLAPAHDDIVFGFLK